MRYKGEGTSMQMINALVNTQQKSAICNFWPQLQILGGQLNPLMRLKVQEFRTGATRGAMDAIHGKEETVRLRTQIGDLRNKLNDLENKVSRSNHDPYIP